MNCKKCGHEGDPITCVDPFPGGSVQVDREDPDHEEHRYGIDVDGDVYIGLEVCRNCKAIAGFWIEDAGDAEFHEDWGRARPLPDNAGDKRARSASDLGDLLAATGQMAALKL